MKKVDELKSVLKASAIAFTKPATQNKAATEASFRVSHLLVKHKPFTNCNLFKEAMAVTTETVFRDSFSPLSTELKQKYSIDKLVK